MKLSEILRAQRKAIQDKLDALVKAAEERDDKAFTAEESTQIDTHLDEMRQLDERIGEAEAREAAEAKTAEARRAAGEGAQRQQGGAKVEDAPVYVKGCRNGNSYFKDMAHRAMNDAVAPAAVERLVRHQQQVEAEQRALGNTNTTGGSAGEFAPPQWAIDQWIAYVRPGRIAAELMNHNEVPAGVSSINIPKITSPTGVGLQSTQNSNLTQTDLQTSYVSTGFSTLGGTQVASQQILDQSAVNLDDVILRDLAAEYTRQVGVNVISGAGSGANNNSVVNGLLNASVPAGNQITYTTASPTAQNFYGVAAQAVSAIETSRFMPPTAWLMAPRRYWWLASKSDSQGRPLIVPGTVAQNPVMTGPAVSVPGYKGDLLGIPVYVDPNIPTNLGAGTNQDTIFLCKWDDLEFYESPLRVEAFREPLAASVGVLFRAYAYVATILNRYPASIATINGTGLVTPVFG